MHGTFSVSHQIEPAILYFGTPVVLIGSSNEDGSFNLAPMSSAWWVGWRCMLGLARNSKTTENMIRSGECVLNLPSAALVGAVDHRLEQRARRLPIGGAQNSCGECEQQEHANHGQHGQEREDVGLGIGAADEQEARRRADQEQRNQQHEPDAPAATGRPRAVDRGTGKVIGEGLLRHDSAWESAPFRLVLSAPFRGVGQQGVAPP